MKKFSKIVATMITALVLAIPSMASAQSVSQQYFPNDLQTTWAKTQLSDLLDAGVLSGYSNANGTYSMHPNDYMTRAQFAQMLVNFVGADNLSRFYSQPKDFVDVTPDKWYYNAVHLLATRGFINGVDATHFQPDRPIKRDEMAWLVFSTLQIGSDLPTTPAPLHFSDVPNDAWYKRALDIMSGAGIISGTGGKFFPNNPMNRAEAAAVMYNTLHKYALIQNPPKSPETQTYESFVLQEEQDAAQLMQAGNFNGLYAHDSQYETGYLKAVNDAQTDQMLADIANGAKVTVTLKTQPQANEVQQGAFSAVVDVTNDVYEISITQNGKTTTKDIDNSGHYDVISIGGVTKLYNYQPFAANQP